MTGVVGEPVSTCSRGTWRAFLRGRQRQKRCHAQNTQKNSKISCATWGGIIAGQFCACKNSLRRNGELVTETTEGHQVFATPPCPGQRRLAIVVAAAFRKCIVNSSFRVRGRNCSVDVCWERKKFRVICSHLNLGSVGRMYARDLEDLSMLVTTRVKDAHVHICVDAQTGLGAGVPGTAQQQHWNRYNGYTSCRKTETS